MGYKEYLSMGRDQVYLMSTWLWAGIRLYNEYLAMGRDQAV